MGKWFTNTTHEILVPCVNLRFPQIFSLIKQRLLRSLIIEPDTGSVFSTSYLLQSAWTRKMLWAGTDRCTDRCGQVCLPHTGPVMSRQPHCLSLGTSRASSVCAGTLVKHSKQKACQYITDYATVGHLGINIKEKSLVHRSKLSAR